MRLRSARYRSEKAWWGYDVIRIADPDGNELLFPLDETNDRYAPDVMTA